MRDNNDGMIELLGATQPEPDVYGCQVQTILNEETVSVQFEITQYEFVLLKKIVTTRPLSSATISDYRYFFAGSYRMNDSSGKAATAIRIEQGAQHKQFWFEITERLLANIIWLEKIKSVDELAQLRY
jgi:hypothetical protein